MALSQEKGDPSSVQEGKLSRGLGRRAGEEQVVQYQLDVTPAILIVAEQYVAGVTMKLMRSVRIVGVSRSVFVAVTPIPTQD